MRRKRGDGRMNLPKLIGNIIGARENHLLITKSYTNDHGIEWNYDEAERAFDLLQTVLTRILVNHQYCGNKDCKCSPKYGLKKLIKKYDEIYKVHLYENEYDYLLSGQ